MLWKAADQKDPPAEACDIRCFGWDVNQGGGATPSVSPAPVAPQELLNVVSCKCSVEGKACSDKRCSCHSGGLQCTEYCFCKGEEVCPNPHKSSVGQQQAEEDHEDEQDEEVEDGNVQ